MMCTEHRIEPVQLVAIGTLKVLDAVEHGDAWWSSQLTAFTLDAISAAVGREVAAGNLSDGLTLTHQGRATLRRLRGHADTSSPRLDIRPRRDCERHALGCWRIVCISCGERVGPDVPDAHLVDQIFELCAGHACGKRPAAGQLS